MNIKNIALTCLGFILCAAFSLVVVVPRLQFDKEDKFLELIVDGRELSRTVRGTGLNWQQAGEKLSKAGINRVGVSRLSLNDLELDKAVLITTDSSQTPFKEDSGDNLYIKVLPSAKKFYVEKVLQKFFAVETKGIWIKLFAAGAYARTGHLFWDREAVIVLESYGIKPVHRFMNHLLAGNIDELSQIEDLPEGGLVLFDEKHALGWPDRLKEAGTIFKKQKARIALVEFAGQIGVKALIQGSNLDSIIVHSITDKEMVKFGESKFVPRWLRAVRERRVRALYMRFFPPENPPAGTGNLFERNLKYFSNVHNVLLQSGYSSGRVLNPRDFQYVPQSDFGLLILRIIQLLALALSLALFLHLTKLLPLDGAIHLSLLLALCCSLLLVHSLSFVYLKLFALVLAVITPAMAILLYYRLLQAVTHQSLSVYVMYTIAGLFVVTTVCVGAGVGIHGFLTSADVLLKLKLFSGVKLVYLVPPVLVFIVGLMDLKFRPDLENVTWLHVLLGVVGLGAAALYILRAGNFSPIPASALEHFIRDTMDLSLPVRPRTKEFLVGYPLLILLAVALRCRQSEWALLLMAGGTVAAVSVVNSFCHLTCSPLLNVIRSYLALLFAFIPGLLFIPVFLLFRRLKGRSIVVVGYFGYSNAGDDGILESVINLVRSVLQDGDEIVVPVKPSSVKHISEKYNVKAVPRYCPWSIFPEMVRCRLLVYGGGGLFQDKSGILTIPYYAGFAVLGRILCTEKIVMFGQGIGDISSSFLRSLTGHVANLADFVQVRDESSRASLTEAMGEISGEVDIEKVSIGSDVFLWSLDEAEDFSLILARDSAELSKKDNNSFVVGVNLRPDEELDESKLKLLASSLTSIRITKLVLLSYHPDFDRPLLERFATYVDNSIPVVCKEVTGNTLVDSVQDCHVVIGMRYHALLSSIVALVPVIGLSYASKTTNLFENSDYNLWCKIDKLDNKNTFVSDALKVLDENYEEAIAEITKLRELQLTDVSKARSLAIEAIEVM